MPVSAVQYAHRYGQPPPTMNKIRGRLTIPSGETHFKYKAGCNTRSYSCRKASKKCAIQFHIKQAFCLNNLEVDVDEINV